MNLDSLTIAAVAAELRAAAGGRRLGEVILPDFEQAAVGLPDGGLFVSIQPRGPTVHRIDRLPPKPRPEPGLQTHLDSLLRGGELVGCEVPDFDRILWLDIANVDRVGVPKRYRLVIELMGKHSACCVLDDQSVILATLKQVTRQVNRHRELLPRVAYVAPPSGGRRDPRTLNLDDVRALAGNDLREAWRRTCHGFSDRFWQCLTTGIDARDPAAVWAAWQRLIARLDAGELEPCLQRDEQGLPAAAYPFALPGAERIATLSAGLAAVATAREERERLQQHRGVARAALRSRRDRLDSRLESVNKRADRAGRADAWQLEGDLILANLHRIEPRAEVLEVPDWPDADGRPTRIALEVGVPPAQLAQQRYQRARKARSAAAGVAAERARISAELVELNAQSALLDSGDAEQLASLAAELTRAPADDRPARPRTEREKWLRRLRRATSRDGYTIFIGTNAAESEGLLSRVAAPDDLWLHVRGAGSGHVIIRTEGRPDAVPATTIEDAARLAARHSKMKHSGIVPVVYCQRKYVTKVTGGAAGKVVYRHEKTLFVEPADAG